MSFSIPFLTPFLLGDLASPMPSPLPVRRLPLMSPHITFLFGLLLLILFGCYFAAEARRKRILGSVLTVLMVAFCLSAFNIHLGLDLQGGTSFVLRLKPEKAALDKDTVSQAVEVIRKRVDQIRRQRAGHHARGQRTASGCRFPAWRRRMIDEVREQLRRVAKLEFKLVNPQSDQLIPAIESGAASRPPGYEIKTHERDG